MAAAAVALLVQVVMWSVVGGCAELLPGAETMCALPRWKGECTVQNNSSPCIVYQLPEGNCFEAYARCFGDFRDAADYFKRNENYMDTYDEARDVTSLKILNIEARILVITDLNNETSEQWWQIDLPDLTGRSFNITIRDLPGRLRSKIPLIIPKKCTGCPPPHIQWISYRKLHQFDILVPAEDQHGTTGGVTIKLFATNKTIHKQNECENMTLKYHTVRRGQMNEVLTVEGMYSTDYCFKIIVNDDRIQDHTYRCLVRQNMTEPVQIRSQMTIPLWWVGVLATTIITLSLLCLAPMAIHKGLLPCQKQKRHFLQQKVRNTRSLPENAVETLKEDGRPFLKDNPGSLGPTSTACIDGRVGCQQWLKDKVFRHKKSILIALLPRMHQ